MYAAAAALVDFATELDRLDSRAVELVRLANSYRDELQSLQVAEWYDLRFGIGMPTLAREQFRALDDRLSAARQQAEQLRAAYAGCESRVVGQIAELCGAAALIAPGAVLTAAQQAALATLVTGELIGNFDAANRLLTGLDSQQVAALFADLDPAAARALAQADPTGLGNLDGVPLAVRATANRILAERDQQRARATGDRKRLAVLDPLLDSGGSLVVYQPSADRYGVLFGDQQAAHVAVFVPGVGGDANLAGWVDDAYAVWARTPNSAVIMWKGYHDPGETGLFPDAVNAAFTGRAEDGARNLVSFADGLALRPDQSLTIVAHSYGSVLAGVALARDGLAPTNVVALGSPGMTVGNVGDLHLSKGQFFDEKAPGDPVADLLGGMGADPASPGFGGTRLATNGAGMPSVSGHSEYFGRGSRALDGISHVITGQVSGSDVQQPQLSDRIGAAARLAVNPLQGPLDSLTGSYQGPGAGRLQLVDHLLGGVGGQVQTGVANLAGSPGSALRAVTHFLIR